MPKFLDWLPDFRVEPPSTAPTANPD